MSDQETGAADVLSVCLEGVGCELCPSLDAAGPVRHASRIPGSEDDPAALAVLHSPTRSALDSPWIQRSDPDRPLIVILEEPSAALAVRWLERGADTVLSRPVSQDELVALVTRRLLQRRRYQESVEWLRHHVATETAGAAAHELSQPLTALLGHAEMMLERTDPDSPFRDLVHTLLQQSIRCGEVLDRIRQVRRYASRPYLRHLRILDLDLAGEGAPRKAVVEPQVARRS